MAWQVRIVVGLAACMAYLPPAVGQQPADLAKAKAKVELRWLETRPMEGLTENEGFQASCDPGDVRLSPQEARPGAHSRRGERSPPHPASVDGCRLGRAGSRHPPSHPGGPRKAGRNGRGPGDAPLTVVVDGKYWGVRRYEKDQDKEFVPGQARPATFTPHVGFFSSKAEAQRLVTAFRAERGEPGLFTSE